MDKDKTYNTRAARLWKLFLSTLYISSFTFGGGFVIVTFMKKKFVNDSVGSLHTDTAAFPIILVVVVYIFAALTFFPVLALGPIAEHLTLWA